MRIRPKRILFLLFTFYALNAFIFERNFYINELISLTGFIIFLSRSLTIDGRFKYPNSTLYKLVFWFIGLCLLHLGISLFRMTNLYYYLRNSVIFYSTFAFFLGFYWYEYWLNFIFKIRKILLGYLLYSILFPSAYLLDRFTASPFFTFILKKVNIYTFFLIIFLNITYAIQYNALTVIVITFCIVFIYLNKNYAVFKLSFFSALVAFALFFVTLIPSLKMYKDGEYHLFGNVQKVYADNLVLQIDHNSSWRAILWYRSVVEKFPENLLGIGFGTPILEYKEKRNSADSDYDDEHDAHVIGMHNTYVTLFVRLGIFYLFIIILIFNCVFKEFYRYRNYYFQVNQIQIFLFFFSVAIIGLFNLIKESPIGASLFWVSLGFVAKAIENRKSYFRLLTSSS